MLGRGYTLPSVTTCISKNISRSQTTTGRGTVRVVIYDPLCHELYPVNEVFTINLFTYF